jgi:EAL domain-containing protein (putative c-di-GMP-specific phosphodiesterase class I)/GGDEF domain-containing protein
MQMSDTERPAVKLSRWLSDGMRTLVAASLLGAGLLSAGPTLWSGKLGPTIGWVLVLTALALLIVNWRGQILAERLAVRLCEGAPVDGRSMLDHLGRLASQLETVRHRLGRIHPVTGLPTREYLCERVAADILGDSEPHLLGAVRFTDFDRLASFDHLAANAALQRFAERLKAAAKPTHVIGQIDRDCFGVWFSGEPVLETASAEFRAIVYVASQEIADGDTILTPAIEAASVSFPIDGADAVQLILRVTAALARPDTSGSGDVALPRRPSAQVAREQFALEQDLAQAIAQEQLTMVFQPVVDLAAGRMIGAEALLRWDHPKLGPVSPARFIPIVEAIGMSERYGLWVLNAACREARLWQDEGLNGLKVAVNLSARQLLDPELRAKIERTLQRHGLAAQALELELTETAAMVDAGRTVELFAQLRAMGVSLAIDDFGTGYSSLSYLKNLPFDKLKIDREFVTDVDSRRDSRAICKALIELGNGLDLLVLAEGVETEAETSALRDLGCAVFQGYHFSKPLSGDGFRRLARDQNWLSRLGGASQFSTPVQERLSA